MSSGTRIDESMEGKRVVNARGDKIGIVSDVRGDVAYVDPDPGIADKVMSMLDWNDADEDDYPLHDEQIGQITDDEVYLQRSI